MIVPLGADRVRRAFRAIALAEALSWAGLLVGMFFKYGPAANAVGVKVFGPIHGAIFCAYVVACFAAARTFRWSPAVTLLALFSSIPPFATWAFEAYAVRRALLQAPPAPDAVEA